MTNQTLGSESRIRPVILSSFAPPALACIRSWGRKKFKVGMVCIKSRKEPCPCSRFLSDHASLPRELIYKDEGIEIINNFLKIKRRKNLDKFE